MNGQAIQSTKNKYLNGTDSNYYNTTNDIINVDLSPTRFLRCSPSDFEHSKIGDGPKIQEQQRRRAPSASTTKKAPTTTSSREDQISSDREYSLPETIYSGRE